MFRGGDETPKFFLNTFDKIRYVYKANVNKLVRQPKTCFCFYFLSLKSRFQNRVFVCEFQVANLTFEQHLKCFEQISDEQAE